MSGPALDALVFVSEARRKALEDTKNPVPPIQPIRALVDTGASHTCLDSSVMKALGLTPTGTSGIITGTTGVNAVSADTYDVGLAIATGKLGEFPLVFPTWKVSSMELFDAQGFHALIGRDILSRCVLFYNGSENSFTLAF